MTAMDSAPADGLDDALDGAVNARLPRHDLDAERSVLGAVMLAPDLFDEVAAVVRPGHFYRPAHQLVFEVISDLARRGQPADAVTVNAALVDRGLIARVGGGAYVAGLVQAPPTAASATYYADIVRRCAGLRDLAEVGTYLLQMGWEGDTDRVEEYRALAHERLVEHEERAGDPPGLAETLTDFLAELENGGEDQGVVPVPYADLQELFEGGLKPGQLVTVAARPAVGKSMVAIDMARHAAIRHSVPVFLASLEMSRKEITKRIVAAESGVVQRNLARNAMTDADWDRVAAATSRMFEAPLVIDDNPHVTGDHLRAALRRMAKRATGPAGLLVVDYIQLASTGKKAENRQVEVSELSRTLKLIAKEFNIPVVMLSQLNRGPEQRTDKKPMLSDLRESGSLEQDSDVVILIHREDAYEPESPRAGEADLIVAKHRGGPTRTVTVYFQGHYARFADPAPDHLQNAPVGG